MGRELNAYLIRGVLVDGGRLNRELSEEDFDSAQEHDLFNEIVGRSEDDVGNNFWIGVMASESIGFNEYDTLDNDELLVIREDEVNLKLEYFKKLTELVDQELLSQDGKDELWYLANSDYWQVHLIADYA